MVMLLTENKDWKKYMDNKDWISEIKRDGMCMIINYLRGKGFKFLNRNLEPFTKEIPEDIKTQLQLFEQDEYFQEFSIHGEFVYIEDNGKDHRTKAQCKEAKPYFMAFDIRSLNNEDLRNQKWIIRKTELINVIDIFNENIIDNKIKLDYSAIQVVKHFPQKQELYDLAEKNGNEGIVLKNINGLYVTGKSKDCIKVKFTQTDDFIVIGYTEASEFSINRKGEQIKNKRFPYFKALILAQYNKDGEMISKGQCGGGFKDVDVKAVTKLLNKDKYHAILDDLCCPQSFTHIHNFVDKDYRLPKNKVKWLDVDEWFVIEVKYAELTEYGNPFQPRFLDFREDKKVEDCIEK